MAKYLISPVEILRAVAKQRPKCRIDKISEIIGEDKAAVLLEKFAGQSLNFPARSTLWRIAKAEYIKRELSRKQRKERKERIRKLARILGMSKPAILRTFESKKYCE
jgi:hypothetical protein